jgi:hypothetical protein
MSEPRWLVRLPPEVTEPFQVYVNGVLQAEGVDYERSGRELRFSRELVKEGRLGLGRWFLGFWGIGTYRRNDTVDVQYERDGHPHVAHALDVEPPPGGDAGARALESRA